MATEPPGVTEPTAAENVRDRLICLINSAHTSENAEANELPQAQEILLKRDTSLMPEFFVHMLDFQVARDNRSRRFTAGFAEVAAKHQPALYLLPCAECLLNLMSDDNAGVLKRAIRSSSEIFRRCLLTLCTARGAVAPMIVKQWTVVSKLKDAVLAKVASDSDTASAPAPTAAASSVGNSASDASAAKSNAGSSKVYVAGAPFAKEQPDDLPLCE